MATKESSVKLLQALANLESIVLKNIIKELERVIAEKEDDCRLYNRSGDTNRTFSQIKKRYARCNIKIAPAGNVVIDCGEGDNCGYTYYDPVK